MLDNYLLIYLGITGLLDRALNAHSVMIIPFTLWGSPSPVLVGTVSVVIKLFNQILIFPQMTHVF